MTNRDELEARRRELERQLADARDAMGDVLNPRIPALDDDSFWDSIRPVGEQVADALREQRAENAPEPERRDGDGFIVNPADEAAYVPLTAILNEHTPAHIAVDAKGLTRYLDVHKQDVRQWRPNPQRRSVHLGDWLRFIAPKPDHKGDDWADDADGVEERTKAIRARKAAGG
jgi:hypothetical protein